MIARPFQEADLPQLLELMKGLAAYEGYLESFAVTTETLVNQGLVRDPPDFYALVVDDPEGGLAGMLVYYFIPFTFRARPTLFIKELFVAPSRRGDGVGVILMTAAARIAAAAGCGAVKWQVARWNVEARRFYQRLGAVSDEQWIDYQLSGDAIAKLADGR